MGSSSLVRVGVEVYFWSVFMPLSSDANMGERQTQRSQVTDVIRMAQPTSISVVLGDLNAELGNNHDPHEPGSSVMSSFGAPRVTTTGLATNWTTSSYSPLVNGIWSGVASFMRVPVSNGPGLITQITTRWNFV